MATTVAPHSRETRVIACLDEILPQLKTLRASFGKEKVATDRTFHILDSLEQSITKSLAVSEDMKSEAKSKAKSEAKSEAAEDKTNDKGKK